MCTDYLVRLEVAVNVANEMPHNRAEQVLLKYSVISGDFEVVKILRHCKNVVLLSNQIELEALFICLDSRNAKT